MSNLISPPVLRGSEQQQLLQLRDYLFQFHRQLGTALGAVESGDFSTAAAKRISEKATASAGEDSAASKAALSQSAAALKSLIVKTSDILSAEMDEITAELRRDYVANSDFGAYQETVAAQFTATADSVAQEIRYASEVAAADTAAVEGALQRFVTETNGYIRQGIIGYNGTVPIIGIAIGQDIQTTGTSTVDGRVYDVIDTSSAMSTFTAEKLSFYLDGTEVAYVSNSRLYISDAAITGAMTLGSWELNHRNGFSVKWVGAS